MVLTLAAAGIAVLILAKVAHGPRLLLLFILAVGILRFGVNLDETRSVSSLWLLLVECSVFFALTGRAVRRMGLSDVEVVYAVFLIWCLFAAANSASLPYASRMYAKLLYPFLLVLLCRRLYPNAPYFGTLLKVILLVALAATCVHGGFAYRLAPFLVAWSSILLWPYAAFSDYSSIMVCLALVAWQYFSNRRYLLLALILAASVLLHGNRTAIMAECAGMIAFAWLCMGRLIALTATIVVFLLAVAGLLLMPGAMEHMFYANAQMEAVDVIQNPLAVDLSKLNSSGRFDVWQSELEMFFWPHPVAGSGLGMAQVWLSTGQAGVMRDEHSSFVRLLSEVGGGGLALFLLIFVVLLRASWKAYQEPTADRAVRSCALIVFCTVPALMVCMAFDTTLDCMLPVVQYPFAFAGLMYGLQSARERSRLHWQPAPSYWSAFPSDIPGQPGTRG